jgi:transposase
MSLHPIDRSEIPEKIAELGHKLLGENNMYRLIGDRLAELVKDEDFIDMYSSIGGPALSPVILSFVLIFQMLEKLPDRLAAEAVRLRIDWKYALHLPLDWVGFHFTNLSHFRDRLLKHEAEYRFFERLLQEVIEMGFIRRRGKQRTDSMSVLGLIAKLSQLEMIWETLRMALKAIQARDEKWLEQTVPETYLKQYIIRQHDYDLKDDKVADALRQAGADGLWLLQQVEKGSAELQDLKEAI